jgi:hypothetical protein
MLTSHEAADSAFKRRRSREVQMKEAKEVMDFIVIVVSRIEKREGQGDRS